LASRWKDLADAIEPWNEPDIELFGGHTGGEIASFHKAAYLGLKAGDPAKPVCGTVFAVDRLETLEEFAANEPQTYFQRYNLHHYIRLTDYPRAYGRHRKVNGGRPMWTTEFNLPVHWADEATKEPSHDELRVQGYRVAKVFSMALHEGVEKAFYFILGDYVERNLQYGLVHHDLTPRPAYIAFAAVGRLLNGARPMGRLDLGDELLKAFVFRTQIDGAERDTIVAWSETKPSAMAIKGEWKAYDYLGRQLPASDEVELNRAPIFAVLPAGEAHGLPVAPPPAKSAWSEGSPSPVVLQLLGVGDVKLSAFRLAAGGQLRLTAYNFSDQAVAGTMTFSGCECAKPAVMIEPGGQVKRTLTIKAPGDVAVRLNITGLPAAVASARVVEN
jgi:hypothetical protein